MSTILVVRLDSAGDVLICGPAIRAAANHADRVVALVGPQGAPAAALLPGVDEIIVWDCPWISATPPAVDRGDVAALVDRIAAAGVESALILTSFHQSALPTAMVLRMAGVVRIAAVSTDYAGSLLDVRLAEPGDGPEARRMLHIALGAGYSLPAGDDGALRVDAPGPQWALVPSGPFVVLHPGASAPSRTPSPAWWRGIAADLARSGRTVLVTGSTGEAALCASVAGAARAVDPARAIDAAGQLTLGQLAGVLELADAVVVGNTGPAHLAAAVGAPIVSLFAPVVPRTRWAPQGSHVVILGDPAAPCRDTRATTCPVPGHPCLDDIPAESVLEALERLAPAAAATGVVGATDSGGMCPR